MKLLHINASPRNNASQSLKIANHFIDKLTQQNKITSIDKYDLFVDELPEFGTLAANAKMALFSGSEQTEEELKIWQEIKQVFDRFNEADLYVFNMPLWNNGIPYKLKQFIDVVTQPGWAFGFDMDTGYFGLLQNKKAVLIQASGVYYQGIQPNFGSDHALPYMKDWLNFIGIENIAEIPFSPTVVNSDYDKTLNQTLNLADNIAATI